MAPDRMVNRRFDNLSGVFSIPEEHATRRSFSLPIAQPTTNMNSITDTHADEDLYASASAPIALPSNLGEAPVDDDDATISEEAIMSSTEVDTQVLPNVESVSVAADQQDDQEMEDAKAADTQESSNAMEPSGYETPTSPVFSPITPGSPVIADAEPLLSPFIPQPQSAQPVAGEEGDMQDACAQAQEGDGASSTSHPVPTSAQLVVEHDYGTHSTSAQPTVEDEGGVDVSSQQVQATAQPVAEDTGDVHGISTQYIIENANDTSHQVGSSAQPVAGQKGDTNITSAQSTAEKGGSTNVVSGPTSTSPKRKATDQDPSSDSDSDDDPRFSTDEIVDPYVWPERSPAPSPAPKVIRKSARLTAKNAKKPKTTPSPPPAPAAKPEGTIDASNQPNSRLLNLPANVLQRILNHVLIHPNASYAPKRKSPYRRQIEAEKKHILTVGFGKITRSPVKGTGMKSNVTKDLNTASPTNFFLVCRALRDVSFLTYYGKNTFAFSSESELAQWSSSLGSRRKFVKSVELRSQWEVFFKPIPSTQSIEDIATGDKLDYSFLDIHGTGLLYTKSLRTLTALEIVDLTLSASMPWKASPDHASSSLEVQLMCWGYIRQKIDSMIRNFRVVELDAPFIEIRPDVFFNGGEWMEPYYPGFLARKVPGESEEAVKLKKKMLLLDEEAAGAQQ